MTIERKPRLSCALFVARHGGEAIEVTLEEFDRMCYVPHPQAYGVHRDGRVFYCELRKLDET